MVERSEWTTTYGGEVEMLSLKQDSGLLAPFDSKARKMAQKATESIRDIYEEPVKVGYDSSRHLIEIGGGVHNELPCLVQSLSKTISPLQTILSREHDINLLSMSHHPVEDIKTAYTNVLPKPIYDLWRGVYHEQHHLHPDVLRKVYPDKPEQGRRWQHEFTTMAASIQPWNALKIENAAEQLALIQATAWMFNLLTANSPFAGRKRSGKRDVRLEIWEPMLTTSRYKNDRELARNLPLRPKGLSDYYKHVFGNQRLMAIPCAEVHTTGSTDDYKKRFRAVVQPADDQEFDVLTYLSAHSVGVVDIYTSEVQCINPSVAHIFNGYDFLYFPRCGARLRVRLPHAECIDPRSFAKAIREGDDNLLQALFIQGGINEGFICIEGRMAATVLPTRTKPDWYRFNIPFVLQTALLRCHKEIFALLDSTRLTWQQLVDELPVKTNDVRYGFKTRIRGIHVAELAQYIWTIAASRLSTEERNLVGDEIDEILTKQKAPAEEQLDLLRDVPDSASDAEWDDAFRRLIYHFTAFNTNAASVALDTQVSEQKELSTVM